MKKQMISPRVAVIEGHTISSVPTSEGDYVVPRMLILPLGPGGLSSDMLSDLAAAAQGLESAQSSAEKDAVEKPKRARKSKAGAEVPAEVGGDDAEAVGDAAEAVETSVDADLGL